MRKAHVYHRDNCDTKLREEKIDILHRKIVLTGKHAFEWSVTVYSKTGITRIVFPNREKARKEFNKYKIKTR